MDNNKNSYKPSLLSRVLTFTQPIHQRIKKKPLVVILSLLLIFVAILGHRYSELTKKPAPYQPPNYIGNVLLILNSRLDNETSPSSLILKFNYPVDVHKLSHYFSLTPKILGKWVVDENDKTVIHYKFDKKYKRSNISLYISQGLTSLNNKTLLSDYETYFTLTKKTQYEPYSRIKSFPAGKAIPIYSNADSITIYKSNAYNLLSFLTYSLPEKEKRGSVYDGNYTQSAIKHPATDKLQNLKIDEEKNTILLDPGVYYVENDTNEPYFVVVSSFGVVLRQDDKQVILGVFNINDSTKISDQVTFGFYNLNNGVNLLRDFTYSEENKSQTLVYPTRLDAVIGIYKDEVAFVPVELPSSYADIQVSSNLDTDTKIFLYTDRPIYKPGDKVFVRGIVRQDSDSLYKAPIAGTTIYLRTYQNNNQEVNQTAMLDEYGVFYTYFILPKDYKSNYSYVQASIQPFTPDNYRYSSANFEVLKYTKPEFEIKTTVEKTEYLRSDKLKFTISGNYFNGKPIENKEITYTLYTDNYYEVEKAVYNKNFNITSFGGMCGGGGFGEYFGTEYQTGKATLNNKGESVVEVNPDDKSLLSQKVTLLAKVVDKNNNEILSAVNTIIHSAGFNIFFIPSAERYTLGDEVVVPFYSESLTGEKIRNTPFSYKLVDYQYNNYSDNNNQQTVIASGSLITDENGKGIVKFVIPKDKASGNKQLIINAKDSKNNTAQNQKSITILTAEEKESVYTPRWGDRISQTYLKISSNQNSFKVNDTINLTIESPKDLDVLLTFERGRIYAPRYLHLSKGNNSLQFHVNGDLSPSITVVFSFFTDGSYHTEGLSLNVPAMHKLLQISLSLNKNIYSPTETAELLITTRDANGEPVAAQMSVGVVDKAIYALRKSATLPIHSSFYYFRPRRTNASSSLTGMGDWGGRGGGGGGGGGAPGSNADILYWNPNLRTDATGEVRIPIPLLGHKTIWKVQVMGSTINSEVGQADTEFIVTSEVKGAKTKKDNKR
ncbi:MAG: MG2 domain-containing protein [Candidatus Levybacteria bacterium]|nr:MG2 domain-containing protein [Candidatus Levybacteria bacterium]